MKRKKTIHSETFQLKQDLLSSLRDRAAFARKIHAIKNSDNYSNIKIVSKDLCRMSPSFEHLIYGHLFPLTYSKLGVCNPYVIKSESVVNEMRWIIHQLQKYESAIQCYSKTREDVENLILLGKYNDALSRIQSFQEKYGVSIWIVEIRLVIYNLQKDTQRILDFITDVNNSQKENKTGFVPYLSYMLYKRSNPKLSAYDFDEELASLSKRNRSEFLTDRYNYFEFKLNYYNCLDRKDYSSTLLMDSTNALVDRYESLVRTLIALFVADNSSRTELSSLVDRIYKISTDNRLLPIVSYANQVPTSFFDPDFVAILDMYYTGDYERCLTSSKQYILKNPSCIDVLKIYCRSLLFMEKNYSDILPNSESLVDIVGNKIYNLMKGEEIEKNIYPLYQLFKNLNGCSISAGLYCFINEERNRHYNKLINLFSSKTFDPYGVYMFETPEERIEYIDKAICKIPDSKSLAYQRNRYNNITSKDATIVAYIRNVDNARILFNKGQYDDCINILVQVENDYKDQIPVVQTSVRYIFDSFVKKEDYNRAISYYVNELY